MAVRLEAATIGPEVPLGLFPVVIHSVFRGALNLQPPGDGMPSPQNNLGSQIRHRHKGPQQNQLNCTVSLDTAPNLITLLSHEFSDQPQGIRLATVENFTTHGLEPNCTGRFHIGGVSLDRPNGAAPLAISFLKAKRLQAEPLPFIQLLGGTWKAGVEQLSILQAQADTDLRIRTLVDHDSSKGFLGGRLTQAALELGEAVRAGTLNSARGAIFRLVGLGSGLTPSGDDFLCGFMTAAHCRLGGHPGPIRFLRKLKRAVFECLSNTNAISATFLRCAINGQVSRTLQDLAKALQNGTDFREAMVQLCAFGHSSGMDITTGFLYGLIVWE